MTDAATLNKIKRIARDVRVWAEKLQEEQQQWDDNLGCMCVIASYELFKRLHKARLDPTICFADCDNYGHAFIRCRGYVVDVTATQFARKIDKVSIVPIKGIDYKTFEFWKPGVKVKSKRRLLSEVSFWPRDQLHPELVNEVWGPESEPHLFRRYNEAQGSIQEYSSKRRRA